MKLNPNCIKDLLEVFESDVQRANITYSYPNWEELQENASLKKYSLNEISYHCQQLYLSELFYYGEIHSGGGISFVDIMPEAHALLANLRIPKTFKLLQKFIDIAGGASIKQMADIATTATMNLLPGLLELAKDNLYKSP